MRVPRAFTGTSRLSAIQDWKNAESQRLTQVEQGLFSQGEFPASRMVFPASEAPVTPKLL